MWTVRVSVVDNGNKQLYEALLYSSFRQALADVLEGLSDIYDNIPDDCYPNRRFYSPSTMIFHSNDGEHKPDDLEVKYEIGAGKYLVVYIGKAIAIY